MEKIPQEQHGFNASQDAHDPNVPQRTHDQDTPATPTSSTPATGTPDTRSHDELFTEFMREHASPEKEAEALQALQDRESAALREFLAPQQEQQQQGSRYEAQPQQQQHTQEPQADTRTPEQRAQERKWARLDEERQRAKRRQLAPSVPSVDTWGTGATTQIGSGPTALYVKFSVGNDDPVYQWLAGKRQALEQTAMLLRTKMERYHAAAWCDRNDADPIDREVGETHETIYHAVTLDFYAFAKAAVELMQCEAELRTLGIEPSRSGITREVWELFHREVVETQTDELDGDGDEPEGGTA